MIIDFKRRIYPAHVIKVYDGDTITAVIDVGFNVKVTERIRLYGINTPEIRGVSQAEKHAGWDARDELGRWILEKDIMVETFKDKKGKYGRYIGIIWAYGTDGKLFNANDWLVEERHAVRVDY